MPSCIPLTEGGKVIGIDGRPLAAAPLNAWQGFRFEVHPHMCRGAVADRCNQSALILVRVGARGRARFVSGRTAYELSLEHGQVDVFAPGFEMDSGWWDCTPGEIVAIELQQAVLGRLLPPEEGRLALHTSLAGADPGLAALAACMRSEVEQGCPSGRLFADGLSLALLASVRTRYALADPAPMRQARLAPAHMRMLDEYVDANLGGDLGVADLAALVKLSPFHFARLFKASSGVTPYRFVLQRRVAAARRLLASDAALAEIAYVVGFASQSHFTTMFRRETGITPGAARAAARHRGGAP